MSTWLRRSPIPPPADHLPTDTVTYRLRLVAKSPRKGAATRCHALTLSLPFQPSGRVGWRQAREHALGPGETQAVPFHSCPVSRLTNGNLFRVDFKFRSAL